MSDLTSSINCILCVVYCNRRMTHHFFAPCWASDGSSCQNTVQCWLQSSISPMAGESQCIVEHQHFGAVTRSINQEMYSELIPVRPTLLHAHRIETSIDTGSQWMMCAYRHIERNKLHRGFQEFTNISFEFFKYSHSKGEKGRISASLYPLSVPPLA